MLQSLDASGARPFMTETTWSFRKLERLDVPVLAEVHGFCLGGGFELALHCDEILAADEAVFAFPETHAGYVTTAGSVARLVAAVGSVRARHLLLSGARIRGPLSSATTSWIQESEAFESLVAARGGPR